jgi:SAM-dependent methyltransferase
MDINQGDYMNWRIKDLEWICEKIRIIYLNGNIIGAEIGSFGGDSAEAFAMSGNFQKLYCIDPWQNGYDPIDGFNNCTESHEKIFDEKVIKYPIIIKIKKTSSDALYDFSDETLDFIYIDGCHTYDAVRYDILNWSKKLKKGGILSGHDYNNACFPGVRKAVDELLDIDLNMNCSWIKFNFDKLKIGI